MVKKKYIFGGGGPQQQRRNLCEHCPSVVYETLKKINLVYTETNINC